MVGLSGSALIDAGRRAGLRTASEAFADRAYRRDGSLAARGMAGSVIEDGDRVAARAVAMVRERRVETLDGLPVPIEVDTICLHGDTPNAALLARQVRNALEHAGVRVMALSAV
jgi:UPF0271 protein